MAYFICTRCPDGDGWIYVPTLKVFRKGKESIGTERVVRKTCPTCGGWGIILPNGKRVFKS